MLILQAKGVGIKMNPKNDWLRSFGHPLPALSSDKYYFLLINE
jgi:hypothetical protein